jgi:hypothetical protein
MAKKKKPAGKSKGKPAGKKKPNISKKKGDKPEKKAAEEPEVKKEGDTPADPRARYSAAEIEEMKRLRRNLYNKKYRVRKKLKAATTKRDRSRLNRQVRDVQQEINLKNRELGFVREFKEIPERKITIKEQGAIQESILPVWEAREKITDLIKGGFFRVYIVGEDEFSKDEVLEIYNAFSDLEDFVYGFGRKTPYVIFIEDVSTREVWINVY